MPVATDYITAGCPALAASPSLNTYIADATNRTNSAFFGINAQKAIALRAMHEFTLDQRNLGAGGAIGSLREGGAAIGYETAKGHQLDVDLDQTSFGKRLRALIRSTSPAASVMGFNSVAAAGMPVQGGQAGMISETNDDADYEDY